MDKYHHNLSRIVARRLAQACLAHRSVRIPDLARVVRGDLKLAGQSDAVSTSRIREAVEHAFSCGGLPGYTATLMDASPGEYCYLPVGISYARMLKMAGAFQDSEPIIEGDAFDVLVREPRVGGIPYSGDTSTDPA